MPILSIFRLLFTLVSLALLGAAGYLLWEWYDGDLIRTVNDELIVIRRDWQLWLGIAMLVWSVFGKLPLSFLLAGPDNDPLKEERRPPVSVGEGLHVEVSGRADAPTLVLTHGWAMDSTIWYYARRDLEHSYRVVTWDLPGLGLSRDLVDQIDLRVFAQQLKRIVEWTGTGPVILVGHSIGGMTIQTLARDFPEFYRSRVGGTVLINTTYTNPLRTMILSGVAQAVRWPILEPLMRLTILLQPLAWLMAWQSYLSGSAHLANRLGFGRYVTRSQLNHTTLLSTRNPPGNVERGNLAMFRWDATGALATVSNPLLIIGGAGDIVTRPDASKDLAAQAPGSQVEIIEGVNHMGFLERHADHSRLIADFAAKVFRRVSSPNPRLVDQ